MTYVPSDLERLQLDMGARAQAHPYLSNVTVLIVRPRDAGSALLLQTNLDKTLAGSGVTGQPGGFGAAILINMPSGDVPNPETTGPELLLICSVRVIENPLINMAATGTMKSAEDLMLCLLGLFHFWFVADLGGSLLADKNAFDPVPDFLPQGKIAYDIRFRVKLDIRGPSKAPMPAIFLADDGTASFAAVPNALVYYTLDGSYPWSGNPTAVLLDNPMLAEDGKPVLSEHGLPLLSTPAPVAVSRDTLVRAVAYLNKHTASDLAATYVR